MLSEEFEGGGYMVVVQWAGGWGGFLVAVGLRRAA